MFSALRLEQLIDQLNDSDKRRQRVATQILIKLGKASPIDLIRKLEAKDDDDYLFAIAAIIVQIGSPAVEALIKTLETNPNLIHQLVIIEVLGQIGDVRAFEPLKTILMTENYVLIEAALDALLSITAQQFRSMSKLTRPIN